MAEEEKKEEEPKPAAPKDGTFEILISPDKLQAALGVTPPGEGGKAVTIDQVTEKVSQMGIQGMNIQELVGFLKSGNFGAPLVIAQGAPATNGVDGTVTYLYQQKSGEKKQEDEFGRIDHRAQSSLIFAKEGEVLARRTLPTPGTDGCNVLGEAIKANSGKEAPVSAGQNVQASADGTELKAARAGNVVLQGTMLLVDPVLVCEGDVDFDVGNIDFDGSVTVGGTISEGFTVKATGDVTVQTVSKANVDVGRNLIVEKGIIGSAETAVKAKGNITAKFIENANVVAGGNIVVAETILHSNASAARHVVARGGKHASIVGGHVLAGGNIEAKNIGSETGTKTQIEIGLDPAVRTRMNELSHGIEKIKVDVEKITHEVQTLTKLKERMKTLPPPRETLLHQLSQAGNQLNEQLKKLQAELADFQQKTGASNLGFVSVKEKAYRGVRITILDQIQNIEKDQTATRFYLNREKKTIGTSEFKEVEL